MQYIVIAHDYKDGLERRLASREEHIKLGSKMKAEGKQIFGVALLNEQSEMKGSVIVCEFDSKNELNEWLKVEPYMTGKVWEKVQVIPCKVGPSFIMH